MGAISRIEWNHNQSQAATWLAEGHMTHQQICNQLDIAPATLRAWMKNPVFAKGVQDAKSEMKRRLSDQAYVNKDVRIRTGQEVVARILSVISERAADEEVRHAPGGDTGLIARSQKSIGSGASQEIVDEFRFDAGLVKELREWLVYLGKEAGDLTEKVEHSGEVLIRQYDSDISKV